ncbi:MAG: hypothetical protein BGO31_09645 [Bacteroidetes bacterium 43-16]|nr:MAG: hypothetical protein BGO31_09645 [Bacteroidetes bacterium 43-16]
MKKLLLVLLSFVSLNVFAQIPKDIEAVKKTFLNFRTAVLNKDGAFGAKQVDENTVKYYQHVLDWTVYADTSVLDTLNVFDRMTVLNLRHRVSKESLLQLKDGTALIKLTIDSGFFAENSVKNFEIGNVDLKYKEGTAVGQAKVDGQDVGMIFKFIREKKAWKLRLAEALAMAKKGMEVDLKRSGKNENEYIWTYLILETGRNVSPEIIDPLKKR